MTAPTTAAAPGPVKAAFARARSEPGLLRNIVVLGALLVLGTTVGAVILGQQRVTWPWEDTYTFSATFEQTPGISPGNGQEVRIAGVAVGQITDAGVDDRGQAVVEMQIDAEHVIYDNARVVLRPKSPLNEMFINVNPGGVPGAALPPGAVLPVASSERPVQIEEVLGHLDANTRDALGSLLQESDVALANAPAELPRALRAADAVLTDLQPVVAELEQRRGTIARLVSSLATVATAVGDDDERLAGLADDVRTTLRSLAVQGENLDASLAQLPGVSRSLRDSTAAVADLSEQLDPTLANVLDASDALPGALDRLTGSVDQLDSTIDKAGPFLAATRPVASDLRPFVADLDVALDDLQPTTAEFDRITAEFLPYISDLQAFVYNTNDLTSLRDANRGIFRGQTILAPTSLPLPLQGLAATPDR